MGKPKRNLLATAQETLSPPMALDNGHMIAKVIKAEGNNLWSVEVPGRKGPLLVELPARFRSTIWLKRGGFVVVDTTAFEGRENKLQGEVVNVVREEKQWKKLAYWPSEFEKPTYLEESDDENSTVGQMPPADDSA
ncbi:MAG: hypothetical protein Q9217_002092 [Psora testacea]